MGTKATDKVEAKVEKALTRLVKPPLQPRVMQREVLLLPSPRPLKKLPRKSRRLPERPKSPLPRLRDQPELPKMPRPTRRMLRNQSRPRNEENEVYLFGKPIQRL